MMSGLRGVLALLMILGIGAFAPAPRANALDTRESPSLVRMRIQHQMDTVEVFRKPDGSWWVAGRGLPAIPELATQTIRQLEALEEKDPQALNSDSALQANGLQLEQARFVRLTFSDGALRWLRLGEAVDRSATIMWARDAGNPLDGNTPAPQTAYRTTGIPVLADIDSWTTPVLFPHTLLEEVDSLRVTWIGPAGESRGYLLVRRGDTALVVDSRPRIANPRKTREIMGQATGLLIDQFVEPGEVVPPRSKKPRVAVRIVLRNGRRYDLPAVASDATHDYVPHPQAPDVLVKLLRVRLDAFAHTADYLATSYPYGPELDDGITGPPPPHFGVIAPHGHRHDEENHPEDSDHSDHSDHSDDSDHSDHHPGH